MEIDFPGSQPLNEAQQQVLEQFRRRLAEMLDDMALSNDEVMNLMQEFRQHPDLRNAFMAELQKVRSQLPGPIPRVWD
ncbi:hypothetical protein EVJ50_05795 [Synechococcus sp. RSCCF101]|nr:hypothetical protein EVJ50_05795 [Synechococcus sp. RSCCF101]